LHKIIPKLTGLQQHLPIPLAPFMDPANNPEGPHSTFAHRLLSFIKETLVYCIFIAILFILIFFCREHFTGLFAPEILIEQGDTEYTKLPDVGPGRALRTLTQPYYWP